MEDLENVVHEGGRVRRAYRRAEQPTIGWAYGLLLVVALVSLFVVALTVVARDIEREVANTARRALDQADLRDVEVSADGQRLTLASADNGQLLKAADLLSTFRYPSWFGQVDAVTDVQMETAENQATAAEGVEQESASPSAVASAESADGADAQTRKGLSLAQPSAKSDGLTGGPALELASAEAARPLAADEALRPELAKPTSGSEATDPALGTGAGEGVSLAAAVAVEPDVPMVAPHFLFIRNGSVLTLTGTMASGMTRDALLATARAIVASDSGRPSGLRTLAGDVSVVTSKSEVAAEPIDPMPAAVRGLALLRRCFEGRASLQGGVFRFRGAAPADEVSVLEQSARAPIAGTDIGLVEFTEVQPGERCEQLLSTAFAELQIEFVADDAVMQGTAAEQLDRVAELAEGCPLSLLIEGRPAGAERIPMTVSLRRANAVRDALVRRGIEADRLSVRGFASVESEPQPSYPISIRVLTP